MFGCAVCFHELLEFWQVWNLITDGVCMQFCRNFIALLYDILNKIIVQVDSVFVAMYFVDSNISHSFYL